MANSGASKCLHVLNAFNIILSFALIAGSLWFYVQVYEFTSLRNHNHYLLDYKVYWPQAIPWMFIVIGLFSIAVTGCGFAGARKSNQRLVFVFLVCQLVVVLLLIAAAVIAFVFADSKSTDDFIKDTVWDVYYQSKADVEVETAFGKIERKLHCCGSASPRDYKNWKVEFPRSCCDTYYHGFYDAYVLDCDFTNKLANERYGCATVASEYARISMFVLSACCILISIIGMIGLCVGLKVSRDVKNKKPRVIHHQHESESKKVLI